MTNKSMNALILSAGIGKRMQPITVHIPKPLLPIVNRTLIELQIERLSEQGIAHFGVNLFHHSRLIQRELKKINNIEIEIEIEDEILGTGGALGNFKKWSDDNFYVQACDMITDLPITDFRKRHKENKAIATIALIKTGTSTDNIEINGQNDLVKVHDQATPDRYTYAGAAVYSPEIFSFLPDRPIFSVVDLWYNVQAHGRKINTLVINNKWFNINTPGSYLDIVEKVLNNDFIITGQNFEAPVYIHESSRVGAYIKGFACIGANCIIEEPVSLENVIVLRNTHLSTGDYHNAVISDQFQCSCEI
ncbi:hypothetical protein A2Y85_00570 [candidate division WOR-3 bacterium RBG_13_43_14]|uniref:Nucleotidyl transferase domain-containing protein n=1 Tax=candidate division WOR-3 bacterium RBG_13_43_14 TaxID=1802590 RepID=A0A1F4UEF4_UNCW3|nr:MAG: hypothetical protein A2Y85_00570 [candidate division WOR-3 bacterium RBG_13_43_14]